MSVPLQSVPGDQEGGDEAREDASVSQARHEAAEIIAGARREAEAIVAAARSSEPAPSPLAALGDNAEEIIGQVRKLIKKQRQLQDERRAMEIEIDELKTERDELVQRLTDAVVRMEELAAIADEAQQNAAPAPPPPPPPMPAGTSLSDRIEHVEQRQEASSRPRQPEPEEDTSLAARLERAEREERQAAQNGDPEPAARPPFMDDFDADSDDPSKYAVGADGRSFYSRHSAKLPRLEGDGGRSVLSAVGGMRPEPEPKGRKSRRRKKG